MLKNVVLLAIPGVAPFEFGVVCEVFGIDRSDTGGPRFDFTIATATPGPVETSLGYDMMIAHDLSVAADADLIAVPAHRIEAIDERFLEVIRAAEARGAWVLSVCSGAFTLAQAGIHREVPLPPGGFNDGLISAEVRQLAQSGQAINAIKLLREQTGLGLKEAKDAVDRL